MLGSVGPAAAAGSLSSYSNSNHSTSATSPSPSPSNHTHTTASPTPTSSRSSRLRGFSYLRSYTHTHLHRSETPPPQPPALIRSTSSPGRTNTLSASTRATDDDATGAAGAGTAGAGTERGHSSTIQSGEHGWIPRSGLISDPLTATTTDTTGNHDSATQPNTINNSTTDTTAASAEPPTAVDASADTMTRSRNASAMPTASRTADQHMEPLPAVPPVAATSKDQLPTIRFIPHVEARSSRPSLQFSALSRTLKTPTSLVRVGRYSERDQNNTATHGQDASSLPVGFKSKVVSRRHCEFWCTDGQWYIKDVKSSSGTFLNHVRLSSPGVESRPYPVNDGDVVQLGIDFKGGEEVIFRCVKIRVECNRGWQKSLNSFNTSAHKRLFKSAGLMKTKSKSGKSVRDSDAMSVNASSECSICLNPVAPCQALFVAPCSHVWHYKCVRNLIHGPNWPNFLCPNCRFVADLEADVEQPDEEEAWEVEGEEDLLRAIEGTGNHSLSDEEVQPDRTLAIANGSVEDDVGDGDSPPRIGSIQRLPSTLDDDLTRMMGQTQLSSPQEGSATPNSVHTEPSITRSRPIPIGTRTQTSSDDPIGARSTTPTSHAQFALSAGVPNPLVDGPMTPRNDAGPFVFDGSAGRLDNSILGQPLPEVSEPSTPENGVGSENAR